MKNLSVKAKIYFTIIALTFLSLGIFAYLSFQSYKKDKLAYIYDSLAQETQAKSTLLALTTNQYGQLLSSVVSGFDTRALSLPIAALKNLQTSKQVLGVYYHIPSEKRLDKLTLYESESHSEVTSWDSFLQAPFGLSLVDEKKGFFFIKVPLNLAQSFAIMSFSQIELANILSKNDVKINLLLNLHDASKKMKPALDQASQSQLEERINKTKVPFGLFELELNNVNYFISYSKLNFQKLVLVNLTKGKHVLLIEEVLLKQTVLFFILIGSISLIIGTISARWLTWHLDELTKAAQDLENENFDTMLEIHSTDELGILAKAFNSMKVRIKHLLVELKRYNTELEDMVEERTRELQNLTTIQKGMLNSLGQGFVLIGKDHKILPVYSKVAEDMFEVVPSETVPSNILGVSEEEGDNYNKLFDLAFSQALDFDDVSKLCPDLRTNEKNQKIILNYSPIKDINSDELDYILVIGTDKTAELEAMEKSKQDWLFSQMILRIAENRISANRMISESLSMLRTATQVLEENKPMALREVQRLIHTIRGNVSYFYISILTQSANQLETYLTPYYDIEIAPNEVKEEVLARILDLQIAIECYIDQYDNILQYNDRENNKMVSLKSIKEFSDILRKSHQDILPLFKKSFFKTNIAPYFQIYPNIVKELASKLHKEVDFHIIGGDLELPERNWDELFQQFIHVIRNAMDHGIETPDERELVGKPRNGTITFEFEVQEKALKITLSDDGKGIDWTKIAAKDPSIHSEEDAIRRIMVGGISSKDEVSDVSGRGVGVSSVFATVKEWQGKAKFINNVGKGTKIIILVPLNFKLKQSLSVAV
jgi:two-component system chemotaxis sensor kinase CheA